MISAGDSWLNFVVKMPPSTRILACGISASGVGMKAFRLFLIIVAVVSGLLPAYGQAADQIVAGWYQALEAADEDGLARLLSEKAIIRLDDIGITQNKTEFLGTMGEWRLAIEGGNIRHRIERTAGDTTTALACYHFPDNDMLVRETFKVADGLIVESVQTRVAEDCSGY